MARDSLWMKIDRTGALKKLLSLERDIDTGAREAVQVVGDMGKQYARMRAPYWSGRTFQNIVLMRSRSKYEAVVIARNPTANDGHVRKIGKFNLVRWMHQSPKAKRHIYSGDPKFMYTTADYLRRTAPVTVQKRYDQLLVKYR
jgi:hypothetical protein